MNNLDKKIAVLKMMRLYWKNYKILPSYQRILTDCEISSKSVVNHIIGSLIDDGFFDVNIDGKLFPLEKFMRFKIDK